MEEWKRHHGKSKAAAKDSPKPDVAEIKVVAIMCSVAGGVARLYDSSGKKIAEVESGSILGLPSHAAIEWAEWASATIRDYDGCSERYKTAWDVRIEGMVGSWRQRTRDKKRKRIRRREPKTTNWHSAISRMVGNFTARNTNQKKRSKWTIWATTKARNWNQRNADSVASKSER